MLRTKMALIATLVSTLLTNSAWAQEVTKNLTITPNKVEIDFCNYTSEPVLSCTAQATGTLNTGAPVTESGSIELSQGKCASAYVYANYPLYFVEGSGDAQCEKPTEIPPQQ